MASGDNNNSKIRRKRGFLSGIIPRKGYAALLFLMALVAIAFMAMLTVVSALPTGYTMALVAVLFALLILTDVLFLRKRRFLRVLGIFMAVVFLTVYGVGTYYLGNTYAAFSRLADSNESTYISAGSGLNLAEDSYNIYVTGIDMWSTEKGYDLERSDVNMIITVSPKVRKILLTSIPRDSYVRLHTAGEMDKLTHTGVYGVDETINTVQDWLGLKMDYYIKMNFSGVVGIINAIGGVDVYSPIEFKPSKRSWWTVQKGWNHMSGKEALAFARERKAFNNEDSIRVENQQRVVDAALRKMMTSPALLTGYPKILKAASDNMTTNMSTDDMQELVRMQLADLGEWDIEMQKIEGEYDMDYVASLTQEQKFQVYRTDEKSVAACLDNIYAVMNPTEKEIQTVIENKKKASLKNFINSIKNMGSDSSEEESESTEG